MTSLENVRFDESFDLWLIMKRTKTSYDVILRDVNVSMLFNVCSIHHPMKKHHVEKPNKIFIRFFGWRCPSYRTFEPYWHKHRLRWINERIANERHGNSSTMSCVIDVEKCWTHRYSLHHSYFLRIVLFVNNKSVQHVQSTIILCLYWRHRFQCVYEIYSNLHQSRSQQEFPLIIPMYS